jgi:hypothetical protein
MKSFLFELREASKACPDILIRKMLKDIADEIGGLIVELVKCPSTETMKQLNASWVRGVNVLAKAYPTPDNNPRSGAGTVEQERLAA